MKIVRSILLLLLLSLFSFTSAFSAPGELDPTFNGNGKSLIGFGLTSDAVRATVIQTDGKIVTAGIANQIFAVARFNSDGSPDLSFGNEGKVIVSLSLFDDCAAVAVQPDGKIIIAGFSEIILIRYDFTLIRLNPDGSFDTNFGTNGIVKTNFSEFTNSIQSLIIQPDGKIVAAGYVEFGNDAAFALARYNIDGSLDTSFGKNGKVVTQFGDEDDFGIAAKLQPDGKIVFAGYSTRDENANFAVARYNSDGSLDASFDGDGTLIIQVGKFADIVSSLDIQADGKIVVGGSSNNVNGFDFAVVRFNQNGSLDTSFDGDGKMVVDFGFTNDLGFGIVIQSDGKIVQVGRTSIGEIFSYGLVRYNSNGSLDTSFGSNGKIITSVSSFFDQALSVALQTDGKIIAGGTIFVGTSSDFGLIRYNQNGSPDASFGKGAIATRDMADETASARTALIQPDGKIVVAGSNSNGVGFNFCLARYNPNGTFDNSFGNRGKIYTPIGLSNETNAAALQTDGKIIVTGFTVDENDSDVAVTRYNSDGSLDTSFGGNGIVTTSLGINADFGSSVAVQPDGKILVGGYTFASGNADLLLIRYLPNGSLDISFDGDGILTTTLGGQDDFSFAIALQSDGKIIIGGESARNGARKGFLLVRYNSNGSLDNSFDGDGIVSTLFQSADARLTALALQNDGKIVAVGYNSINEDRDFALARYNPNGSLDTSFDSDGTVTTAVGSSLDGAFSVVLQPDGKILAAGESYLNASNSAFAILRYNPNGSLDNSFAEDFKQIPNAWGNGGKVLVDLTPSLDRIYSIKLDAFNRPVAAGAADALFGVVRLQNFAPTARLSGKVVDERGFAVARAQLMLTFPNGDTRLLLSSQSGRFNFGSLPTAQNYIVSIKGKSFRFNPNSISYQLFQDYDGLLFVGSRP